MWGRTHSAHRRAEFASFLGECMNDTRTQEDCVDHQRFARRRRSSQGLAASVAIFLAASLSISIASPLTAAPAQEAASAKMATDTVHYDSGGFQIEAFVAKPSGG